MAKKTGLFLLGLALAAAAACAGGDGQRATDYYRDEQILLQQNSLNYQFTYNPGQNYFFFDETYFDVRFTVFPDRAFHFQMDLLNQSQEPIVIYFDRAIYLDYAGRPHALIHEGEEYYAAPSRRPPVKVAPGQEYRDLLRPADRQGVDGATRLVPIRASDDPRDFSDQVTLAIPMLALGQTRTYRFTLPVGQLVEEWPGPDPGWLGPRIYRGVGP